MFNLKPKERLFRIDWAYGLPGTKDSDAGSFWFAVTKGIPEGQEFDRLLRAIRDYYKKVPKGKAERARGHDPNWGDAIADVNFKDTGFRLLNTPVCTSHSVDHDQVVYDFDVDG